MLTRLYIQNFATIKSLEVSFGAGFSVLTGETGAGKSIMIEALQFVLGYPSQKALYGSDSNVRVEASFIGYGQDVSALLDAVGIEAEAELVLRRNLSTGSSRSFINGSQISRAQLLPIAMALINIHGQHHNQQLLDKERHIDFLDGYKQLLSLRDDVGSLFQSYKNCKKELEQLYANQDSIAQRRLELQGWQSDIEALQLESGEIEELRNAINQAANSEHLTASLDLVSDELVNNDMAVISRLENLRRALEQNSSIAENLKAWAENLSDIIYQLDDISREASSYRQKIDFSPQMLNDMQQRLAEIEKMARKLGLSEAEILPHLAVIKQEQQSLSNVDEQIKKLEVELERLQKALQQSTQQLSEQRLQSAQNLEKQLVEQLKQLGMKDAQFEVRFNALGGDNAKATYYGPKGKEKAEFYISTNKGKPPLALAKIASGGELSRIMLALKTVLAEIEPVGTLVFDEVDSGISGATAEQVGDKMRELGHSYQVLCITHLPQIAALANSHFCIVKDTNADESATKIIPLDDQQRVEEIARLLSGVEIGEHSLASAREMLSRNQH